jgi:hypothetical protein
MHNDYDSPDVSEDQRRREVAATLARGVLRLKHRRASIGESIAESTPQKSLDLRRDRLELPVETVLSVHTG